MKFLMLVRFRTLQVSASLNFQNKLNMLKNVSPHCMSYEAKKNWKNLSLSPRKNFLRTKNSSTVPQAKAEALNQADIDSMFD
jgi:hypothetical protein